MDRGTDAIKMLTGEDIPLRLGYVGVKNRYFFGGSDGRVTRRCRSQADIRENMRVKEALQHEKEWFESHPKYNKLPPGLTGTGEEEMLLEVVEGWWARRLPGPEAYEGTVSSHTQFPT